MSRVIVVVSLSLGPLLASCTCNADDVSFPAARLLPTPPPPPDVGRWLSLDTAPDGTRLIASFHDQQLDALGWAQGMPSEDGTITWSFERADGYPESNGLDLADVGQYTSQETSPDGTVWVAYRDSKAGALRVAHRLGPSDWEIHEVDAGGGGAGTWNSLVLDADGNPVVAHCDEVSAEVRLSRFDGTAWQTDVVYRGVEEEYLVDDVVETRPAGVAYTRLFVDEGTEYIAFYDRATQSLNMLEGTGSGFTHTVVHDDGDVGAWPSIGLDEGALVVAYHDQGNQDLRLATRSGGSWSTELIDDRELRGSDSEVFVMEDTLNIVYFDGFDSDVVLASRSGGGWNTEVLGAAGLAVGFHNEVTFAAGQWWAGSYDLTNRGLFVRPL